jgi:hypothetical protein
MAAYGEIPMAASRGVAALRQRVGGERRASSPLAADRPAFDRYFNS